MLTVTNSPFRENVAKMGTGIAGPAYLYNAIIADSISGADCWNAAVENQANLLEDGSCGATIAGDPMLGPLADNGGGSLTHLIVTPRANGVVSFAPLTTTIAFAETVPPSLGSATGTSLPVQVTNRIIEIRPMGKQLYLPLIQAQ